MIFLHGIIIHIEQFIYYNNGKTFFFYFIFVILILGSLIAKIIIIIIEIILINIQNLMPPSVMLFWLILYHIMIVSLMIYLCSNID